MKIFALPAIIAIVAVWCLPQTGADSGPAQFTLEKFNKIEIGMTYEQVVEIIGFAGVLRASGIASYRGEDRMYTWSRGNAEIFVDFVKGRAISKGEFGLSKSFEEILRSIPKRRPPAQLSIEKYNALKMGLTYAQAVAVIGSDGEEQEGMRSKTVRAYSWTNSDLNTISATFTNGRLSLKSQFGIGKWLDEELGNVPNLRLEQFDAIKMGTKYAAVEAIIGGPGRVSSATEDRTMNIETVEWRDARGGVISVIFSQYVVTSKSRSKVYPPDSVEMARPRGEVTLANFAKLKPGITRAQATAVFETPGVSVDFTQSGKLTVETVEWRTSYGALVTAIFNNGTLGSANQSGLR